MNMIIYSLAFHCRQSLPPTSCCMWKIAKNCFGMLDRSVHNKKNARRIPKMNTATHVSFALYFISSDEKRERRGERYPGILQLFHFNYIIMYMLVGMALFRRLVFVKLVAFINMLICIVYNDTTFFPPQKTKNDLQPLCYSLATLLI